MSENSGQLLVKARFNFEQTHEDELTFNKGDIISVTRQVEGGWWVGTHSGKTGWFPSNYVREVKGSGRCHKYRRQILMLKMLRYDKNDLMTFWQEAPMQRHLGYFQT